MNQIEIITQTYYKKYLKIPVAARAAMWFVFCTMLQKCIAFITVPIFTRLMPTAEYGLYSTYLSWYSILTSFCTLNMHSCIYVNQYTKLESDKEKDEIAVALLSLSALITMGIFVVYLVLHKWIDRLIGLPFAMICLLFMQILFEPPVAFWSMKQRFEYKYIILVIRTILMVVLNALLGIVFVYISSTNQGLARVTSIVIVQIIFGFVMYYYFFKRARKLFSVKGWREALRIQLPLLPHSLSINILSSSDRILIHNMVGVVQAGIYGVAYSAGYIINVLKSSIVDALRPWLYQKIKNKDYSGIKETVNILLIVITLITILFTAFAPEIITIMAPSQYHEAIYIIPPVAASSFFTFLYNIFSIVSMYYEKTKKIMVASVFGAILNIVLNIIFIPIFGYIVAGYTTLACYMFFAIAHYSILCSLTNEGINQKDLFDMPFIITMAISILATTIVFNYIYPLVWVRYLLILLIIGGCWIKRKILIDTLQTIKGKNKKVL